VGRRRVVVTGLGIVSPVGIGVAAAWESIRNGRSGVARITRFDCSTFPTRIAAEVKDFDPLNYMDKKEARRTDPFVQFALAATREAAIRAITDTKSLAAVVRESADTHTRLLALARIEDGPTLLALALKIEQKAIAVAAVERLADPEALKAVAGKAKAGAAARREGRFHQAHGGTLFLDEIGDMDLPVQAQLLKVIEEKTYRRVGETHTRQSDFRLICATNRNLSDEVQKGRFRSDLFFRINLFPITLPPLRERPEDVPQLVEHFLNEAGCAELQVPPEVMDLLRSYGWPGNIRELRNVVERAMLLARRGKFTLEHFPGLGGGPGQKKPQGLKDIEKEYLQTLIAASGGDMKKVAEALDVSRATLYRRLKDIREGS